MPRQGNLSYTVLLKSFLIPFFFSPLGLFSLRQLWAVSTFLIRKVLEITKEVYKSCQI